MTCPCMHKALFTCTHPSFFPPLFPSLFPPMGAGLPSTLVPAQGLACLNLSVPCSLIGQQDELGV